MVERVLHIKALPTAVDGSDRYPSAKPRGFLRPRSGWNVASHDATSNSPVGR
jgi:hypothetical protein